MDMGKKRMFTIAAAVLCVMLAFVVLLYANHEIGIGKSALVSDLRSDQQIADSWITGGECSDTMGAYLSYPEDKSDHTFSLYVNRPGLSFGYFFRGGGTLAGIDRSILELTVEGYPERAYLSMNHLKVSRLEIQEGNSVREIDIDPENPFALVLPETANVITFYDSEGGVVEVESHHL